VAKPSASSAPAIVVLQEVFGVNADMRQTCNELADKGFIAVCPDLFWRQEPRVLAVTQGRLGGKAFGQSVTIAAWKTKPSWFIVTADDRVVSAEFQAAEAKRMGAKTTVIHSSHVSLLSHPMEVAAVIEDAAGIVTAKPQRI
jgi:hypothetical protein